MGRIFRSFFCPEMKIRISPMPIANARLYFFGHYYAPRIIKFPAFSRQLRIMINIILNRSTALSPCGSSAGMISISPSLTG